MAQQPNSSLSPSSPPLSSEVVGAPSPSLYIRQGEQILADQLAFKDLSNSVRALSNNLTSSYPFVRIKALEQLMEVLKMVTQASMNGSTGHPIDTMLGIAVPNAMKTAWHLTQQALNINLISPLFHKIFPRRDLVLALAGGVGIPLHTMSREAALQWTPCTKPETLEKLGEAAEAAAVDAIKAVGTAYYNAATSAAAAAASHNNNTNYQGDKNKHQSAISIKTAAGDSPTTSSNAASSSLLSPSSFLIPRQGDEAVLLSATATTQLIADDKKNQRSQQQQNAQKGAVGGNSNSGSISSNTGIIVGVGNNMLPNTTNATTANTAQQQQQHQQHAIALATANASRQQSIQKGILAARLALFDVSLYEQEVALRAIQGLCVLVPQQKINASESPLLPMLVEACHCCLQHVQQLALVERNIRTMCSETIRKSIYYLQYHEALIKQREEEVRFAVAAKKAELKAQQRKSAALGTQALMALVSGGDNNNTNNTNNKSEGADDAQGEEEGDAFPVPASLRTVKAFSTNTLDECDGGADADADEDEDEEKDHTQRRNGGDYGPHIVNPTATHANVNVDGSGGGNTSTINSNAVANAVNTNITNNANNTTAAANSNNTDASSNNNNATTVHGMFHGGGTREHPEVLLMRPELIAVMCALIDAVEAACHYCSKSLGHLVQIGGVKHMLALACCPYTPALIRCSIFDTLSLLMKEADPFRKAVISNQSSTYEPMPALTPAGDEAKATLFYMDRATASKFDSAVRSWLSVNHLFPCINTLLTLRDVGGIEMPLGGSSPSMSVGGGEAGGGGGMSRAEAQRIAHKVSRLREKMYTDFITEVNQRLIGVV